MISRCGWHHFRFPFGETLLPTLLPTPMGVCDDVKCSWLLFTLLYAWYYSETLYDANQRSPGFYWRRRILSNHLEKLPPTTTPLKKRGRWRRKKDKTNRHNTRYNIRQDWKGPADMCGGSRLYLGFWRAWNLILSSPPWCGGGKKRTKPHPKNIVLGYSGGRFMC